MNWKRSPDPDLNFLARALRFQDGGLHPEQQAEFERELRDDPHKRRLFIEAQERSLAIRTRFIAEENEPATAPRPRGTWRSLLSKPTWAAAAGVVIGLLSATLVSGESFPFRAKLLFETRLPLPDQPGPPPHGIPNNPGMWSGDYSGLVPAQNGITPLNGSRMLQIRRADHEGKPHPEGSRVGSIWYLVDLRPFRGTSPSDSLQLRASFCINSTPASHAETHSACVSIHAVSSAFVSTGKLHDAVALANQNLAATSRGNSRIDADPQSWEKLSTELRTPQDAEFALVSFNVIAPEPRDSGHVIQFEGKYMDDLQISLVRR